MQTVTLKPAFIDGEPLKVRKPQGGYLATQGELIVLTTYWRRRRDDGDVVAVDETQPDASAPADARPRPSSPLRPGRQARHRVTIQGAAMPDNIIFNTIPTDIRTPGQYVEIDNSKALRGLPSLNRRIRWWATNCPPARRPADPVPCEQR